MPYRMSVRQKFEKFNRENPHVLAALIVVAEQAKARGFKRTGINFLSEIIRWEKPVGPTFDEHSEYKLCNTYRPYYARLIVATRPDLADMFELRKMTGEAA